MELTLNDLGGESRPIVEDDFAVLRGPKGAVAPPRKKLRYKHHALARSLASGMSEGVAATITGFTPGTVSILKRDPAFVELVAFYATEEGKGFNQVRAQLLGVGQKFIEELDRRVTNAADEMTVRDLREAGTAMLDRAGFGPEGAATTEVHIHSGLAEALQASRVNAPFPQLPPVEDERPNAHGPEGRGNIVIDVEYEEVRKDLERKRPFKWAPEGRGDD